jgi:DNA-binding beta-propeller fold protein YncE
MNPMRNLRPVVVIALLLIAATCEILRERRPTFIRPGLHMNAYVGNAGDGTVTVVDLIKLASVETIPVGPAPTGLVAHPTRNEVWGVSATGGYAWVINAPTGRLAARIAIGAGLHGLDFSSDGRRAYAAASATGVVAAIDCATRQVVAWGHAGRGAWTVRGAPGGKLVVVANRDEATVSLLDAETLAPVATLPVIPQPDEIAILPDGSKAFIASATSPKISVVRLDPPALLANLSIGGAAADLVLKPDGGELYAVSPQAHGVTIVDTWTNEVADFILLGAGPTAGVLTPDASLLYVADGASGHVIPVRAPQRQMMRPIAVGAQPVVCRINPGGELLLVVDEGSDDLAVIGVRDQRLITLVPVGHRPDSVAVKLF